MIREISSSEESISVQVENHRSRTVSAEHSQTSTLIPAVALEGHETAERHQISILIRPSQEMKATHLGTIIENRNAASVRSIVAFVPGDLSSPVRIRIPDAPDNDKGAIPIAGRALSARTPCGRSRAMPIKEASTVITRSWRYSTPGRCLKSGSSMAARGFSMAGRGESFPEVAEMPVVRPLVLCRSLGQ